MFGYNIRKSGALALGRNRCRRTAPPPASENALSSGLYCICGIIYARAELLRLEKALLGHRPSCCAGRIVSFSNLCYIYSTINRVDFVWFDFFGGVMTQHKQFGKRLLGSLDPVSYTHLDVYKRQTIRRIWA